MRFIEVRTFLRITSDSYFFLLRSLADFQPAKTYIKNTRRLLCVLEYTRTHKHFCQPNQYKLKWGNKSQGRTGIRGWSADSRTLSRGRDGTGFWLLSPLLRWVTRRSRITLRLLNKRRRQLAPLGRPWPAAAVQRHRRARLRRSGLRLVHGVRIGLVRHHLGLPKLGGNHFGVDLVAMLAGNVAPDGVVAREWAVAEGAGHTDALVPLANVSPQVCLVAVGPLAEWALQLGA